MKININDSVTVKLTEPGEKRLKDSKINWDMPLIDRRSPSRRIRSLRHNCGN